MNDAPRPEAVIAIRRALISVSDKAGLAPFARALVSRGVALVSTGGSARALQEAGLPVTEVAEVTGFPEMLDGRVKTLHPAVHGGLLARRDRPDHLDALAAHGIGEIDLLVCNLYPFAATVASGADRETCIENIDIGGPALIRAAAKNHEFVTVVTDPADYDTVLGEIASLGGVGLALRRSLARKAYALTAAYDAAISLWFARDEGVTFPETLVGAASLVAPTRYGENPHQRAALYRTGDRRPGVATARQLQGKELSYNNYADADAAYELVAEFAAPAVAIIKHANPCGAAIGASLREAWEKALECDPVSAFGGIVALNRPLDAATAAAIAKIFVEVIIAPEADPEARDILARKEALRLLVADGLPDPKAESWTTHELAGGLLIQERDRVTATPRRSEGRHEARPDRDRDRRPAVRRHGGKARQVERDRLRARRRDGRHRRRPDEPRRQRPHRRPESGRSRRQCRIAGAGDSGIGRRVGRLLPVRRRARSGDPGRRHRCDPARRLAPRRRGDRSRRPGRDRDGVHRSPPLPALTPPPASASWRSQLRNARTFGRSRAPGAVTM